MIKIEPENSDNKDNCMQMEIKQERELILEPDEWVPSKIEDEQQEYYQQNQLKADDEGEEFILPSIKPEPEYQQYSIEYIDEEEYSGDDSNDNRYGYNEYNYEDDHDIDEENESSDNDEDMDNIGYMELGETLDYCNEERDTPKDLYNVEDSADGSETFCKDTFLKWLCGNYIQHVCPICNKRYENYRPWSKHIDSEHQDLIDGAKSNFFINEMSRAICKLCNKQFNMDFILLIHSLRHASQNTVKFFICTICDFESTKSIFVLHHIMEKHPHVEKLFKTLKIEPKNNIYECPLCPAKYEKYNHIRYHFLDNHQKEFWERFRYKCYICGDNTKYHNDELYYKHLLEEHNLNDPKILNFIKFSENPDEQYFSCTKCFKLYTEMNIVNYLKHFLEHETKSFWLCKFCNKKFSFKYHSFYHVCSRMLKIYQTRKSNKSITEVNTPTSSVSLLNNEEKKLSNWQQFEEYIIHVCPFCNKEFNLLHKWQMHLRKLHKIDTLKGLEMSTLPDNPNKLQCKICCTLVINTSIQLHTHRFQHLPYKPYKCRHCPQTLNNYRIALSHVLNQCHDTKDQAKSKGFVVVAPSDEMKAMRESIEISCSFCQNQNFPDIPTVMQHFEDKHNNFIDFFTQQLDKSMICNLCRQQFAVYDKNLCISHIIQHMDQKTYKCRICPQSYHTHKVCMSHLKRSHFAHAINTKKETDKSLKNSHIPKAETLSKARMARCTEKSTILKEFIEFITYACPECNESLINQQLWHDHISYKHHFFDVDNLGFKDPADGFIKCQHCQLKLNTSLVQRQKHILTHMPYRSFICTLCYHRCTSLGVLYGHLRRVHFNKGSYKCPICPVLSTTSYERSEHIKTTHPRSEWPVTMCLVCYKTLSSRNSLSTHMVTHDINREKFECKYCGAKLCDIKDLKIHVARHESKEKTKLQQENDEKNSKTKDEEQKIDNDGEQKDGNDGSVEANTDAEKIDNEEEEKQNVEILPANTNAQEIDNDREEKQNDKTIPTNTDAEKINSPIENDQTNEFSNTVETKDEISKNSTLDINNEITDINTNAIKVNKRKFNSNSAQTEKITNAKKKVLNKTN